MSTLGLPSAVPAYPLSSTRRPRLPVLPCPLSLAVQSAVELYLRDHPTLESLAIELPPGAPFAAREYGHGHTPNSPGQLHHLAPHALSPQTRGKGADMHPQAGRFRRKGWAWGRGRRRAAGDGEEPSHSHSWRASWGGGAAAGQGRPTSNPFAGLALDSGGPGGGGGGKGPKGSWPGGTGAVKGGAAAGFWSPFAVDPSAAAAAVAASGGSVTAAGRHSSHGGGGGGAWASVSSLGLGVLHSVGSWMAAGGGALTEAAVYVTSAAGGAVSGAVSNLAALAGAPFGDGDAMEAEEEDEAAAAAAAAAAGTVSPQYCWLLASVVAAAPALRALYVHNHALPDSGVEGAGRIAAALAGNTRLATLSLRGSSVGDAGAAALARALEGGGGGGAGGAGGAGGGGGNSTLTALNLRGCQLHDEGAGGCVKGGKRMLGSLGA